MRWGHTHFSPEDPKICTPPHGLNVKEKEDVPRVMERYTPGVHELRVNLYIQRTCVIRTPLSSIFSIRVANIRIFCEVFEYYSSIKQLHPRVSDSIRILQSSKTIRIVKRNPLPSWTFWGGSHSAKFSNTILIVLNSKPFPFFGRYVVETTIRMVFEL